MPNGSAAVTQAMRVLLTPERSSYLAATGGDLDRALDLYEWNARLGAAVFEDLGYLEVVLRGESPAQNWQNGTMTRSPTVAPIMRPAV